MSALVLVISFFVIRIVIIFSDKIFGSPWDNQLIARDSIEVVKDIHGAINSRMAAVCWFPLTFIAVTAKIPDACGSYSVNIAAFVVLIVALLALGLVVVTRPMKWFQGPRRAIATLLIALVLDTVIGIIPSQTITVFCASGVLNAHSSDGPGSGSNSTTIDAGH